MTDRLASLMNFESELQKAKISTHLIDKIRPYYDDPKRFFHNTEHIISMLKKLTEFEKQDRLLIHAIIFHDLIYDPKRKDNEEESCKKLWEFNKLYNWITSDVEEICKLIMSTKDHKAYDKRSKILNELDMDILIDSDFSRLLEYETKIFKEYQSLNIEEYKKSRIEFLIDFININLKEIWSKQRILILCLIEYIKNKKYKIGIYPGSFNPFHIGHLNILEKAEKVFDKVILVQAINPDKKINLEYPYATTEFPLTKLESINNREIILHKELITGLFNPIPNVEYTLIRGLRNEYDLNVEENYRKFIKEISLNPIEFAYFFCDLKYEHISSSQIKSLMQFNRSLVDKYLVI